MKQWQVRGEVLDSDDEYGALDLGFESPSPERPQKRARLSKSDSYAPVENLALSHSAEHDQHDEHQLDPGPVGSNLRTSDTAATAPPVLHKTPPPVYENITSLFGSQKPLSKSSSDESPKPGSGTKTLKAVLIHPFDVDQQNYRQDKPQSSPQDYRLDVSGDLFAQGGNFYDDSSSDLSEREISPPPGFQFLNPATQAPQTERTQAQDVFSGRDFVRRNLRVRKEIQLHPYLLDRAQYLKQCRLRGMKPVRLQEHSNSLEESQDLLIGPDHTHETASSPPHTQSPARSPAKAMGTFEPSLDYFSFVSQSSESSSTLHRLPTRRQAHPDPDLTTAISPTDEFSFAPSPARTNSQLATPAEPTFKHPPSPRFRLPFGMTPAQLPTPQISSDVKGSGVHNDSSSDSLPSKRLRLSKIRKTLEPVAVESPSDSSASEDPDVDVKRLRRERKRIKGVLPASWLRLDLHKQQGQAVVSPARPGDSPGPGSHRKGVAQRINPRHAPQSSRLTISDESGADTENEHGVGAELPEPSSRRYLPRLHLDRLTPARSETIDDGAMENNWFDPMFASTSHAAGSARSKRSRQPRITDVFQQPHKPNDDSFSNERVPMKHKRPTLVDTGSMRQKRNYNQRIPRDRPTHLSIVDAPRSPNLPVASLPQFVKVALRQTKKQRDLGRHSPTDKLVRLTTERDTEDALSVLRAWRSGKLNPVSSNRHEDLLDGGTPNELHWSSTQRTPLAERSSNDSQPYRQPTSKVRTAQAAKISSGTSLKTLRVTRRKTNTTENWERQHSIREHNGKAVRDRNSSSGIHFPRAARVRGAQIESLASEFHQRHRAAAFERRMQRLTVQAVERSHHRKTLDTHNASLLRNKDIQSEDASTNVNGQTDRTATREDRNERAGPTTPVLRRRRKNRPTRIDAEAREFRQPLEPKLPLFDLATVQVDELQVSQEKHDHATIHGLNAYGSKYTSTFDVRPLPFGVYFQEKTFVGSGEFRDSLHLSVHDADRSTGFMRVDIDNRSLHWSPWTEDVASGFGQISESISSSLHGIIDVTDIVTRQERNKHLHFITDYLLRSVVRYCSNYLWFADPVDRRLCCESLHCLVIDLTDATTEHVSNRAVPPGVLVLIRQYCLVITHQALQLCAHDVTERDLEEKFRQLFLHIAESLVRCTFPGGLPDLQSFYEDVQRSAIREAGVNDREVALTSVVLLHHTLNACKPGRGLWNLVNVSFKIDTTIGDVSAMEKLWYSTFTILPALEFDSAGIAKRDSRLGETIEDWSVIRGLLIQVLKLYESSSRVRGSTINDYVRTLFHRCHVLVNKWGWWRCEQPLGTIYDFFASRSLAYLNNEENHGSPRFLESLTADASFDIEADDCAFHIFLKILASGLRGMQRHGIYPDRKIGSIAWRFIPSHGRTYKKDVELQTSDLDALRNHFDLLTTLYFASPVGHRPRIELLRNLVDHEASHREACRLSIRAWANVATFQASASEPAETLQPLIEWVHDILRSAIAQYRLARSEVEHDVTIAEQQGTTGITSAVIESTVAKNQRQIAATLVDVLAGIKRVLENASNVDNVAKLTVGSTFTAVFELFDPSQRRLAGPVTEAINVANTALDAQQRFRLNFESQHPSEDSQDFGDSSALQELVSGEPSGSAVSQVLHDSVGQFMSNVLGSDEGADDTLIQAMVDLWIRLIRINVDSSQASWVDYIDDYSPHSWNRLRDTLQRRKFTPYFMACILNNTDSEEEIRLPIITTWILSLVDREAVLKYQHILFSTLLKQYSSDPLLQHLAFMDYDRNNASGITLQRLRQHRLELISRILSNMRESCEEAGVRRPIGTQGMRIAYAGILRKMMQTMKTNYQELQTSHDTDVADANVQGAYVEFIQQVVTSLQQHTAEICPIDRFFTDSTAFPLPATDPAYVIGRLRSYAPKLSESKTRKQLAVFVQTVSERAATDTQQVYLVDQFSAAVIGSLENDENTGPSLRRVLLTSIFPAYYDGLISRSCDWILALPMLEASERVLADMLYSIDISNERSVTACVEIMQATIHCANRQCTLALFDQSIVWRPQTYRCLSKLLDVARACLTLASYIHRSTGSGNGVVTSLNRLRSYSTSLETRTGSTDEEFLDSVTDDAVLSPWPDLTVFAANQIRSALDHSWYPVNGHYEVRRGNSKKTVATNLEGIDGECDRLRRAIRDFNHAHEAIFSPGPVVGGSACKDWELADLNV